MSETSEHAIETMYPVDIARAIHNHWDPREKQRLFARIDHRAVKAHVLSELDAESVKHVLSGISHEHVASLFSELGRDDATDLLGKLPQDDAQAILNAMTVEEATQIAGLLQYPECSAGGVMTTQYVAVPEHSTVRHVFKAIRKHITDEMIYSAYVVDSEGKLVGVVDLLSMLQVSRKTPVTEIMNANPVSVTTDMDQEDVAQQVAHYDLLAIPVVQPDRTLVGIITVDDVVDVIQEESTEDLLRMSGISMEGDHDDNLLETSSMHEARRRLPWLFTNMIGSILAGYVLWFFRLTIQEVVALVTFIPIITALAGNAGLQSSTLMICRIAVGRIDRGDLWALFVRESGVALLMGAICGGLIMLVTFVWHAHVMLGVVVGLSLTMTFLISVAMATALPVLLKRYGLDPAVAAAPLITTATDIASIAIYLTLATVLISSLT